MPMMTEAEFAAHQANPNIVIRMQGGKSFRCECGCNVFHHPCLDKSKYKCNSCGLTYTGE